MGLRFSENIGLMREAFETVEKWLETMERGIEAAEKMINDTVSFGGLAQASAVVRAEAFDFSHLLILFLIDW